MTFQPDRLIKIAVATKTSQSALLQGLDTWLRLNLISDTQLDVTVTTRKSPQSSNQSIEEVGAGLINMSVGIRDISLNPPLLSTDVPQSALLAGLNTWLQLGLLDNAQISVELTAKASHPTLLEGLDTWVQLGLLPEDVVKQLCQENLSCLLPQTVPVHQPSHPKNTSEADGEMGSIGDRENVRKSYIGRKVGQMAQSLIAELSVMWLLLLGV